MILTFEPGNSGAIVVPLIHPIENGSQIFLLQLCQVLPCFVGSVFYLASSILCIWMWKSEQFGMGLMRWMNHHTTSHLHHKVGKKQFVVLNVCVLTATAASWNLCLGVVDPIPFRGSANISRSLVTMIEMCGFFLLFSFLHRTPKATPAHSLMKLARYWLGLRAAVECWSVAAFVHAFRFA